MLPPPPPRIAYVLSSRIGSQSYLAASLWLHNKHMTGFSQWARSESDAERRHAMVRGRVAGRCTFATRAPPHRARGARARAGHL